MRNVLYVLIIIVIAAPISMAQMKYGVFGGLNLSNQVRGWSEELEPKSESQRNMAIGAIIDYPLNDVFKIRAGIGYLTGGSSRTYEALGVKSVVKTNVEYLILPAMVKIKLLNGTVSPYVLGGMNIGVLLSSDISINTIGSYMAISFDSDTTYSEKKHTSTFDPAISFGTGVSIKIGEQGIITEVQYTHSLVNIRSDENYVPVKNKGLLIGLGFIF